MQWTEGVSRIPKMPLNHFFRKSAGPGFDVLVLIFYYILLHVAVSYQCVLLLLLPNEIKKLECELEKIKRFLLLILTIKNLLSFQLRRVATWTTYIHTNSNFQLLFVFGSSLCSLSSIVESNSTTYTPCSL